VIALKIFEDLIFVDDKLPAKAAKIMSLENLNAQNFSDKNIERLLL